MGRNIIEVHFSTPPEGNNITYYFVMTGLVGVCERIHLDRPLGQHSLQVRLVGACKRAGRLSLRMVRGMG